VLPALPQKWGRRNQIARISYHTKYTKYTKKCGFRTNGNAVLKELGPKNLNWVYYLWPVQPYQAAMGDPFYSTIEVTYALYPLSTIN
jgi:hypothetical protein